MKTSAECKSSDLHLPRFWYCSKYQCFISACERSISVYAMLVAELISILRCIKIFLPSFQYQFYKLIRQELLLNASSFSLCHRKMWPRSAGSKTSSTYSPNSSSIEIEHHILKQEDILNGKENEIKALQHFITRQKQVLKYVTAL